MEIYHERNERYPEGAVDAMFAEWRGFEPSQQWRDHLNVGPIEARKLLTPDAIEAMGKDELTRLLWHTHAARQHAKQILKTELGDTGRTSTEEERCALYAELLLNQRTSSGGIRGLLRHVIWDDSKDRHVASRIYSAVTDSAWRLRHLRVSIIGELVGYARPHDYPPRNTRVSKTLHALGFTGIRI